MQERRGSQLLRCHVPVPQVPSHRIAAAPSLLTPLFPQRCSTCDLAAAAGHRVHKPSSHAARCLLVAKECDFRSHVGKLTPLLRFTIVFVAPHAPSDCCQLGSRTHHARRSCNHGRSTGGFRSSTSQCLLPPCDRVSSGQAAGAAHGAAAGLAVRPPLVSLPICICICICIFVFVFILIFIHAFV